MRFTFDLRVYLLSTMSYRIVLEVDSAVKLRGAGGEGREDSEEDDRPDVPAKSRAGDYPKLGMTKIIEKQIHQLHGRDYSKLGRQRLGGSSQNPHLQCPCLFIEFSDGLDADGGRNALQLIAGVLQRVWSIT